MSVTCVAILGCLYLASTTAFNSLVTGVIQFLYLSYAIPIVLLLMKGRNNIPKGKFFLGKLGLLANIVTLSWTIFTLIFFSFPFAMPASARDMNYVNAVLAMQDVYA